MRLHREERDNYVVGISVEPDLTGTWQASFDGGTTWIDGIATDDNWAWLVAGPDFNATDVGMTDGDTVATISRSVQPLLRLKDDPIVDVQRGPTIDLWS